MGGRYAGDTCAAPPLVPAPGEGAPGPVRRALAYLHQHFTRAVPLDALARVARVSKYHLVRVFQRVTGLPPHAYLTRLRVAHAMALLAGGAEISDAAYSAGFSAQTHLHRHFVRLVGVTPGRYARHAALARARVGAPPAGGPRPVPALPGRRHAQDA